MPMNLYEAGIRSESCIPVLSCSVSLIRPMYLCEAGARSESCIPVVVVVSCCLVS